MKTGKRLSVLLLIVSMLLLNGCWNYQEIEKFSMVSGFAIDRGTEGHKYHLTFEFLDLSGDNPGSKLLETEGDTVFDGIRNAISKSQKKLTFSECKVVVISKDLASEGITPLLDFVSRDAEPRLTLVPMISEEKTAGEILQQKPVTDHLICLEIDQMLAQNVASLSKTPRVKLYQANNMLAGEGTSLVLPSIKVAEQQTATTVELAGTAIFKKDKLIGFLDADQSQLLLFIKNQIKGGLLLTSPDSDGRNITLEIEESGTKITPILTQNPPAIKIEIKTVCALGENQTAKKHIPTERIQEVEKSAKSGLETSVSNLIKTAQKQYKTDIFGFGNLIYQNDPQLWEQDKPKWDEIFTAMDIAVTADIKVNNTARVGD